ncbi:hypothetical protein N7523_005787 [Penicillium sp. IBT 18751x]|nr:hypothetical protein N7523_005622 [Penicillium sp. IBT 18751x]KAJ6118036.1 hypothetical protein N7523_005787 [Penicillium sp. IBT 18751x]
MVSGLHGLSLNDEWLRVRFVGLGGEVYNGSFLRFKCRSTPSFPVECLIVDRFNTIPVALRTRSGHSRDKVIYEGNRSSLAVDLSLYEVCDEEEE